MHNNHCRTLFTLILLVFGVSSFPVMVLAQTGPSYARIAILKPNEGQTVDFEAGYIRHLEWHKQAGDPWIWYGWTLWASERQRWFIYATFGHSAADFDKPVAPAEDEKDNILNVVPHASFAGNGLYEFLPAFSSGNGVPQATPRVEFTTVDLKPGEGAAFENALKVASSLKGEVLWYRMVAGAEAPRYVRLRTLSNLEDLLSFSKEHSLPEATKGLIKTVTVEILALRPTMSLGIPVAAKK